jgi:hypothetical protein
MIREVADVRVPWGTDKANAIAQKMHAGDYQDKRTTESDAGDSGEQDRLCRVARLDCRQTDDTCRENEESNDENIPQ